MNRCPITYLPCAHGHYSPEGIRLLSAKSTYLNSFPYTQSQQLELALGYADKLSIQGVQPKLSAVFDEDAATFKPIAKNGTFILKLQHRTFSELPQNEDLTMRLAKMVGIEVPLHGMIYSADQSLLYFIQRFDREKVVSVQNFSKIANGSKGRRKSTLHKTSVEDFAQLASLSRDTKYDFSMEKLVPIIEKYCTFPLSEKQKLFRLTLFSFLIGNEDLHLKNFSLIRHAELTEFSPAYDLVNSAIVLNSKEELALPLKGKKSNLSKDDLVSYYGHEKLGLPEPIIKQILEQYRSAIPKWEEWVGFSFLSDEKKASYLQLLKNRARRIFF
jgi:serine/threonine-protein kinase HipA